MGKIFPANINRYDPYKAYRFFVYLGKSTTPVAAVSKVGAIKRSSEVIEYKEAGNAVTLKGLGRTKYEPITIERSPSLGVRDSCRPSGELPWPCASLPVRTSSTSSRPSWRHSRPSSSCC